jgi:hypothetical protein
MNPQLIQTILSIINIAEPGVAQLITMIRHKDGTQTAVFYLDEADTNFSANQKQIADWFASKGKTPPPATGA